MKYQVMTPEYAMEVAAAILENRPMSAAIGAHLEARIEREFTRRWNTLWGGRSLLHGRDAGADAVRLNGNDYLHLTGHPDIIGAQTAHLRRDADFVIQSGVFLLDNHPSRQLERELAAWIGHEDGLLCQSGYNANLGLLQAIADPQTPVFIDSLAHTSLWEGARRAGAPTHPFRHNDPAHLAKLLGQLGPGLVVVDSVYSTTGAVCPLEAIVDVAEQGASMVLVDESHSLGTHGPTGAGLTRDLGLTGRVHFVTASLAKAFAGRAGFMSLPTAMRNYVLSTSYPNMFSSCLLPHEIAGLSATLNVIRDANSARAALHHNTRWLREALSAAGYPIHQGTEQIIALEAGTEPDTMVLRDELEARGVFGAVFCAPATSRNRAMVRLTLHAGLAQAELDHVASVARAIAAVVQPWKWPVARRARANQSKQE